MSFSDFKPKVDETKAKDSVSGMFNVPKTLMSSKYFQFYLQLTRPTAEAKQCSNIISFQFKCNKGITYHNFSNFALVSLIHDFQITILQSFSELLKAHNSR